MTEIVNKGKEIVAQSKAKLETNYLKMMNAQNGASQS